MHIFDVCFPSWRGDDRIRKAFSGDEDGTRYLKYKNSAFLDCLDDGPNEQSRTTRVARHRYDPSMYRHQQSLSLTSLDALSSSRIGADRTNTVYLPGPRRKVQYDDSKDVLFLRFRDGGAATDLSQETLYGASTQSPVALGTVSEVLETPWSPEMATTLQNARRIALDVAETWTPTTMEAVLFEEIAYLACCLQKDLEVLYLVDHCPGRCKRCNRHQLRAKDLQMRGDLVQELHEGNEKEALRTRDVVEGVGKIYHEVFDLEALGWDAFHPTYMFARMITEAIKSQQRDTEADVFKGVRILLAEDDRVQGVDTSMLVDCDPEDVLDYPYGKVWGAGLAAL
jgi:hypothetical protein